ncbi:MAG TPA: IS66 family transposase [Isosphaeraceae bacterium]|nr:IS66 family transposase [Isosphaeraceae bacterium]
MNDPDSSPLLTCPECGKLRVSLDEARLQIAQLQTELRDLRAQLNRNSSNSSTPPSADPPGAPKPVVKTPTGRKPGGQPGHRGHHRQRLPPERINTIVPYLPTTCAHCQAPLPAEPGPGDPEPTWHQVAELPELAAVLTEHQGHARTCPCCGGLNRGAIPPEIRAHVIGPRLAAVMSYFSGRHHIGRRGVEEVVETVFEVPISLGSVFALERETSAALASPYHEAQAAVRDAPVKNTDETGWSENGQKRWLWGAATATVAFFVIHLRRNFEGLQALLGETITGIVGSDRWAAYSKLPLELRQICWAHLKRDFQKLIDRGGPAEAIGRVGLEVVECLFADWWAFRRGELDRPGLQARLDPIARELQAVLEQGRGCADSKAATFCANVLALYPALWLFAAIEGVEPTNNHAERILRLGVLWRKNAFGCHSPAGCRFVERMLTVVQTLRLQKRPVLDYLHRAIAAHRAGLPAPRLLSQDGN